MNRILALAKDVSSDDEQSFGANDELPAEGDHLLDHDQQVRLFELLAVIDLDNFLTKLGVGCWRLSGDSE